MISAYIPAPFFKIWDWIKAHRFWSIAIAMLLVFGVSTTVYTIAGSDTPAPKDAPSCVELGPRSGELWDMVAYRKRCPESYDLYNKIAAGQYND